MPKYRYEARDARGQSRAGLIEAEGERDALARLRGEGLTVSEVKVASEIVDIDAIRIRHASRQITREQVVSLSAQLSVMLETGVPLSEALDAVVRQSKAGPLRRVVEVVVDRVNSGVSLSAAVGEFPRAFPTLMVALLRASEASGALGEMLGRVSEYLGRERQTVKQIKGALMYPAVMLTMAIGVTVFLVAWVLPRFARIYESRSAALPTPTRILMAISDGLTANWALALSALVASIVGFVFAAHTERGRHALDWLRLNAPLIGPIFRNFYLSRATRTLGTLLAAGVDLLDAISIVRGVTRNAIWERFWTRLEREVTNGQPLADVVLESSLIPPASAQMIAAGDRSGRLPEVLERVAAVCEEDLEESIKNGTQMIEPIVITFMGVMIGGIAIALLLPIFTMGTVMGGK